MNILRYVALALGLASMAAASSQAADKKPNILVIWGDDIGNPRASCRPNCQ